MFDFKYHIVSLVAVFLALGIGVVMGSMTAERGVITEQEKSLIATMEKDFEALREDNAAMAAAAVKQTNFAKAASGLLLTDKIAGKSVAVVVTGAIEKSSLADLQAALETAGAKQQSVTRFSGNLGLDDKAEQAKVAAAVGYTGQNTTTLRSKALEDIARWISDGANANGIAAIATSGFMQIQGSYDAPVQCIIIIGGAGGAKTLKTDELDAHLIKSFLNKTVTVVGAEAGTVKTSYMSAYQTLGISTVDNIDEPAGRISTIFVLAGQSGNYGVKNTADALMPAPARD